MSAPPYVAFVPARSGSTRLPGKNTRDLAGKPLIAWTLEAFADVEQIDKVVFSTDSEEYFEIAKKYVAEDRLIWDKRSAEDAGSKVKIFDYLLRARDTLFPDPDTVFLMGLPTVPLRTAEHVEAALTLYEETGAPVFSACEYEFPVSFSFFCDDEAKWQPVLPDSPMLTGNTQSQSQRTAYHPNGAIYVRPAATLDASTLKTLYDDAVPYLMDRLNSIDIDNASDFALAEAVMSKQLV